MDCFHAAKLYNLLFTIGNDDVPSKGAMMIIPGEPCILVLEVMDRIYSGTAIILNKPYAIVS